MEKLPDINLKDALIRMNGNQKLFRKLLFDFEEKYASVTEEIRELLNKGDLHAAKCVAHSLKGLSGNLSADAIYSAAGKLEAGISEKNGDISEKNGDISEKNGNISEKNGNYYTLLSQLDLILRPVMKVLKEWKEADEKKLRQNELSVAFEPANLDLIVPEQAAPVMMELARFLGRSDIKALTSFESLKEMMGFSKFRVTILKMEKHIDKFDFDYALSLLYEIAEELSISL